MDLDPRQTVEILGALRQARADVSRDVEAFHQSTLTLERIAHIAGVNVRSTLGQCRQMILDLFAEEEAESRQKREELFDTVLRARNMAVHGGAWVRHHTSRLVDLFLMLEEGIIRNMETIDQIMVRAPLEAKPWHLLAHARSDMLSNSFSVLPIFVEATQPRWMLLSDQEIMRTLWELSQRKRDELLSCTIDEAIRRAGLRLHEAGLCNPRDPIRSIAKRQSWPVLVVEEDPNSKHLVGIVTPFDLL